jgi:hypothetical protein
MGTHLNIGPGLFSGRTILSSKSADLRGINPPCVYCFKSSFIPNRYQLSLERATNG